MTKIVNILKKLRYDLNIEIFFTGGFVRDYLRRKENSDLDIVIRGITLEEMMTHLKKYGKCKIVTLSQSRVTEPVRTLLFSLEGEHATAQITLPKRGRMQIGRINNSLKQDAKCRDFKLNAMYLPITYKTKNDIIDFFGGVRDIENKTISSVLSPKECFAASPIRMLRMVRLAATLGYRISKDLIHTAQKEAERILSVQPEIIRNELDKILLSKKPSRYLELLQKIGILKYILPELDRCVGIKQDPHYHKYDVFTHSILTVDNLEADLVLRLAGLFHDIGKAETYKEVFKNGEKHITFHKHEVISEKLTRDVLSRLRYSTKIKNEVTNLVRMHMYHYTRYYTDTAVRRFLKKAGITEENVNSLHNIPLFKLRAAERLGNGFKREPITQRQKDFEKRIRELFAKKKILELKDIQIDGNTLISAFNLEQGPIIGEILAFLLEKVEENPTLNNRIDLVVLAGEFIKKKSANQ